VQRGIVVRVGHLSVANRALEGEGLSLELLCFARSWPWPWVGVRDLVEEATDGGTVAGDAVIFALTFYPESETRRSRMTSWRRTGGAGVAGAGTTSLREVACAPRNSTC
jgi:hypothetical protein